MQNFLVNNTDKKLNTHRHTFIQWRYVPGMDLEELNARKMSPSLPTIKQTGQESEVISAKFSNFDRFCSQNL